MIGADAASGAGRAAWDEGLSAFGEGNTTEDGEEKEQKTGGHSFELGGDGTTETRKRGRGEPATPEDIGTSTTEALMAEIQRGGVCDSAHQPLVLLLMAIGPEQLSKVRLGQLTPRAVKTYALHFPNPGTLFAHTRLTLFFYKNSLRVVKAFFGVTFNIQPEPESGTVFLSTVGAGIRNISRRAT